MDKETVLDRASTCIHKQIINVSAGSHPVLLAAYIGERVNDQAGMQMTPRSRILEDGELTDILCKRPNEL